MFYFTAREPYLDDWLENMIWSLGMPGDSAGGKLFWCVGLVWFDSGSDIYRFIIKVIIKI